MDSSTLPLQNATVIKHQVVHKHIMLKNVLQGSNNITLDLTPLICNEYTSFLSLGTVGD